MRTALAAVGGLIAGYILGALAAFPLVQLFSTNRHQKDLEIAMTGAFFTGPIMAVVGAIVAVVLMRRYQRSGRR